MSGSDLPVSNNMVHANAWATLARDVAARYRLLLERRDPRTDLRYVAVARSLDVRPYAVVTSDLEELRQALYQGELRPWRP